jgi:hypothetical protein
MRESHAFGRKFVDIGRVGLAAVAADIAKSAIIGDNENKVGFGLLAGAQ